MADNQDQNDATNIQDEAVDNQSALETSQTETDPYMYTKRDFTSEVFKIEIENLPQRVGYTQVKKLLAKRLKLRPHKVKLIGNTNPFVFVTFKSEEDRDKALKAIDGYGYKGRELKARKANPIADPLIKKRKSEDSSSSNKKLKEDADMLPEEEKNIKDVVIPLWNVPYEEQLKQKEEFMQQFLIKLGNQIAKVNDKLANQMKPRENEPGLCCCQLLPIRPSPVTVSYRNKNEFTVGMDTVTGMRTVGFRMCCYKKGSIRVAEPADCTNIPEAALKAAKAFQGYVQKSSKEVFNPETHEGYWRQLTVRTSRNNDLLLMIVMHPQQLTQEELKVEEENLTDYFKNGDGVPCNVTSLFLQLFAKKEANVDSAPMIKLFGKDYIEETVLSMTFRIGPKAFFQVNRDATEVLYSTIGELAEVTESMTLLDICCGTGTIGLTLAKHVAKVIGIESCAEAVDDANQNAEINGISNAEFVCGKAEDVIREAISAVQTNELVAIVDPPRAGLHPKVVKSIRSCDRLKKLLYVSCNPSGASTNFVDLCRAPSNNYKGSYFVPVKAVPVDLFPHTSHCELVILFEKQE